MLMITVEPSESLDFGGYGHASNSSSSVFSSRTFAPIFSFSFHANPMTGRRQGASRKFGAVRWNRFNGIR